MQDFPVEKVIIKCEEKRSPIQKTHFWLINLLITPPFLTAFERVLFNLFSMLIGCWLFRPSGCCWLIVALRDCWIAISKDNR